MAKKAAKAKAVDSPSPADVDEELAAQAAPLPPPPAPVSVPAKASCLTFVILLITVLVVVLYVWLSPQTMNVGLGWAAIVGLLVLVIPIVVYRAVALWMFDESSRYPDLSQSWRAGVAELSSHGMSLSSAPLFLVIGTGDEKLRRSFMNAAGGEFFVDGACDAPSPIYWYANADGIFLYLNDVTWMNAAVTLYEMHVEAIKSGRQLPGDVARSPTAARKAARAMGTLVPGVHAAPSPTPVLPSDQAVAAPSDPSSAAPQAAAANPGPPLTPVKMAAARYLGTLTPDQVIAPPAAAGAAPAGVPSFAAAPLAPGPHAANRLTSQESAQQLQRLEYVCSLLRRQRHPLCPVNGILVLLPFEMLKARDQDVAELERAVAADLSTISRELQLRCPVTAVVVGMDQEKGFRELIRRIGREDAARQRFGQRFDIRTVPTAEELRKFTTHVCLVFEEWVYTLFKEEQALSHPGNTSLYAMLCKVRRTLKTRLGDVLSNGFGYDRQSGNLPVIFSGCYFAATGPKSDRQAFVGGLLSKLYDEQEEIEWTDDALREDQRRAWITRIGWGVCGIILLAAAGRYVTSD